MCLPRSAVASLATAANIVLVNVANCVRRRTRFRSPVSLCAQWNVCERALEIIVVAVLLTDPIAKSLVARMLPGRRLMSAIRRRSCSNSLRHGHRCYANAIFSVHTPTVGRLAGDCSHPPSAWLPVLTHRRDADALAKHECLPWQTMGVSTIVKIVHRLASLPSGMARVANGYR